jgi:hypothetical protein
MDKTIVGVLAAIGAIAPAAGAQAAVTPADVDRAMNAGSFAELLQSVPNASAILNAAEEMRATQTGHAMQVAWHHHHHHHHHWWYHHHHHHHWYYHHHHHHWW